MPRNLFTYLLTYLHTYLLTYYSHPNQVMGDTHLNHSWVLRTEKYSCVGEPTTHTTQRVVRFKVARAVALAITRDYYVYEYVLLIVAILTPTDYYT